MTPVVVRAASAVAPDRRRERLALLTQLVMTSCLLTHTAQGFQQPLPPLRTQSRAASLFLPSRRSTLVPSRRWLSTATAAATDDVDAYAAQTMSSENSKDDGKKSRRFKDLDLQFVKIGIPSLVQFTASPLAALVDTIYLGRLGPLALGGASTAIAAQYSVAKLANDPLLRTSISLVATGSGAAAAVAIDGDEEEEGEGGGGGESSASEHAQSASLNLAVSTALLLAITVGAVQAVFYSIASRGVIRGMGIGVDNPMFGPAVSYLRVRALGAPAETLWLVTNGIFRGLGDTVTPLKWAAVLTVLNAILDPLFIFPKISLSLPFATASAKATAVSLPGLNMGCAGAAAGTAVAQYVALAGILWELRKRASPCLEGSALLKSLKQYVSAGVLVLARTFGKVGSYTLCGREAALLGPVAAAAHGLMFNLGIATTQVCESVAVATQTLLAREMGGLNAALATASKDEAGGEKGSSGKASRAAVLAEKRARSWHIIKVGCGAGGLVATVLSLATLLGQKSVVAGLTNSPPVRAACLSIMPIVLFTQVAKGLAYPVNGVIMGGLDWGFSTAAMWAANAACISIVLGAKRGLLDNLPAVLRGGGGGCVGGCVGGAVVAADGAAAGFLGGGGGQTLGTLWLGLAAFMWVQVGASVLRFLSGTSMWSFLRRPRGGNDETIATPVPATAAD